MPRVRRSTKVPRTDAMLMNDSHSSTSSSRQRNHPNEMNKENAVAVVAANNNKNVKKMTTNAVISKDDVQHTMEMLVKSVNHNNSTTTREFLNLMGANCNNNLHVPTVLKPGLSIKEQRQMIYDTLQQQYSSVTQKSKSTLVETFFQGLHRLIHHVIEEQEYIPDSAFMNNDDDDEKEMLLDKDNNTMTQEEIVVNDAKSIQGLQFLYYATLCIKACVNGCGSTSSSNSSTTTIWNNTNNNTLLYPIVQTLHDVVDEIDCDWGLDAIHTIQAIVTLCETWWHNNGPNRENVIHKVLPIMVETTLQGASNNKTDIKRLYAIRTALNVIDWDDPSSVPFMSLLLRCTNSPHYLKTTDGKRFISFLLSSLDSTTLRQQVHCSIRAQIPDNNKVSILKDYGEIYFMAWKDATAMSDNNDTDDDNAIIRRQQAMETEVLDDLVYAVVHVANPTLVQSLLHVLSKFHSMKQTPTVESLLHRLYGPILWRALAAANAHVRINATKVLAHVFPLSPPAPTALLATTNNNNNSKKTNTKTNKNNNSQYSLAVQKGCTALQELLRDPDPNVRVEASATVASILCVFWDGIPSNEIRKLLNHLVAEHASDASSAAVRVGAVNAITTLLDAPQSHAVLRELLPAMGNLIHDKVEKVRLAVVKMLLRIKDVPNVKYYHIVPLDHLAARFAEDGQRNPNNSVASSLTSLMVNSYFPQPSPNVDSTEQIRRALKFLTDDPDSATVFYANVSKYRSVDSVGQLAVQLFRCLYSLVQEQQQQQLAQQQRCHVSVGMGRRRQLRHSSSTTTTVDDDESVELQQNDSVGEEKRNGEIPPIHVMAGLAETIVTLWRSIETKVQRHDEWKEFLMNEFSAVKVTSILTFYRQQALQDPSSISEDSDDDEEEGDGRTHSHQDCCHRICLALLQCAAMLPSSAVNGFLPYIVSVLSTSKDKGNSDSREMNFVTAHVALLCAWDRTDEVATSLATSIRSVFGENGLFCSPDADSKKRRSRRTSKVNSSTNVQGTNAGVIPNLPPRVALHVISDVLRGSNPNCIVARDAMLHSPLACEALNAALHEGIRQAELILDDDSCVGIADTCYILLVCELYGRWALHRESSQVEDLAMNEPMNHLLHWTSNKIIPVLQRSMESSNDSSTSIAPAVPFVDPNLSSIFVEKSFDTMGSSTDPFHRLKRQNRNRTPQTQRTGLRIFDDDDTNSPHSMVDEEGTAFHIQTALAASLMMTSCELFSEWLAVVGGGGETGGHVIAQAATNHWCQIFAARDDNNDAMQPPFADTVRKDLIPFYFRLAIQLAHSDSNFTLLKQLLMMIPDKSSHDEYDQDSYPRRAIAAVLSSRGNKVKGMIRHIVQRVVEAARDLLVHETCDTTFAYPESLGHLWRTQQGCITSALSAILGNATASHELARVTINALPLHAAEALHSTTTIKTRMVLFDLHCLWMLCDGGTKVRTEVSALVVRQLEEGNNTTIGEEFQPMVTKLLDACAANGQTG